MTKLMMQVFLNFHVHVKSLQLGVTYLCGVTIGLPEIQLERAVSVRKGGSVFRHV